MYTHHFHHNCRHCPLTLTIPGRQPTLTIFPVLVTSFLKPSDDNFLKKSLCDNVSRLTSAPLVKQNTKNKTAMILMFAVCFQD